VPHSSCTRSHRRLPARRPSSSYSGQSSRCLDVLLKLGPRGEASRSGSSPVRLSDPRLCIAPHTAGRRSRAEPTTTGTLTLPEPFQPFCRGRTEPRPSWPRPRHGKVPLSSRARVSSSGRGAGQGLESPWAGLGEHSVGTSRPVRDETAAADAADATTSFRYFRSVSRAWVDCRCQSLRHGTPASLLVWHRIKRRVASVGSLVPWCLTPRDGTHQPPSERVGAALIRPTSPGCSTLRGSDARVLWTAPCRPAASVRAAPRPDRVLW